LLYTVGDILSIAIERTRLFERNTRLAAVEERNRIAREIHDTLAQGLAGIALQLETADAHLQGDRGEDGRAVGQAQLAVEQALALAHANLDQARRSVLDLRAAPLEGRTLAEALVELCEERSTDRVKVKAQIRGANGPLPSRIEMGLYRIAQEALANAVRHAGARSITVRLATMPTVVRMTVEDDGRGFDYAEVGEGRFGLIGMNERARLLGGTFDLRSSAGEGTSISVAVPLQKG
jgi:two-component system NarL family sensor kinase